jgi:heptosyltransferase-3
VNILLVKTKNIGDALLLTAAARAIRRDHPHAKITVVVRRGTEGILHGAVSIDQVSTLGRAPGATKTLPPPAAPWWTRRYDVAIDFGGTSAGRWATLWGQRRSTRGPLPTALRPFWEVWKPDTETMHHAERDFRQVAQLLALNDPVPALEFDPSRADGSLAAPLQNKPFAILHPATRWSEKSWPLEKWTLLARHLQHRGLYLVLSCGPSAEEIAFCDALGSSIDPSRTTATRGRATWAQLAGLMFRAQLFVGVDTAAMHLAAACQCPTLALMVYDPRHWGPWQVRHRVIHAAPDPALSRAERMQRIDPAEAIAAADVLLASHGIPH